MCPHLGSVSGEQGLHEALQHCSPFACRSVLYFVHECSFCKSGILYNLGYFRSPVFIFTSHRSLTLTVSCQDVIQGCSVQRESSKKACF